MDFQSNLEFLCRVCAANTKGKNSVAECVYILKTIGLRDKLDRFLYLKVFENDALPKVLCKSCYRQVEATASLSKIAKHTQQVFRDFLFSSLPKGTPTTDSTNTSEYTSSDFLSNKKSEKHQKTSETTTISQASAPTQAPAPAPPPAPATTLAQLKSPPPLQTLTTTNATPRKDEVIVNVSVSDPLTRENQQKVISNSQRRHSIMIEAATVGSQCAISTSLLQKSQKTTTTHSSGNSRKSSSPARVLQFCTIAPKPLQQAGKTSQQTTQQVTTFSSGGYVIGPMKPPTPLVDTNATVTAPITVEKDAAAAKKKTATPLVSAATSVSANDNTILQQKRKNLVKALNNIKANSTGQISLLKSSQQKQQSLLQNHQPTPPPASKSPMTELNAAHVVEDELPDRIIIAAPKNKQSLSKPKTLVDTNSTSNSTPTASSNAASASTSSVDLTDTPPQAATPAPPPKPSFPEDILLGRVIRDVDLLKLILKALKWPVNKQNMELQLNRLKSSRFTDIMSDTNLLQDTDLTQLLGPYLAPVLMAAQALQQQQQQHQQQHQQQQQQQQQMQLQNKAAATTNPSPASPATPVNKPLSNTFVTSKPTILDPTSDDINKAIPYKLPPETSVQLVPALPEESSNSTTLLKRVLPKDLKASAAPPTAKRQRKSNIQKHRDSIVISDEEESCDERRKHAPKQRVAKPLQNFEIDLTNPSFLAQLGLINGTSSEQANQALLALLQKQKMTMAKQQITHERKRRNSITKFVGLPSNEFDALIDIDDDIVLMEPVTTTTTPGSGNVTKSQTQSAVKKEDNNFAMPVQSPVPLITRPIIKRRKTVIQSSRIISKDLPVSSVTHSTSVVTAKDTTKDEQATSVLSQVPLNKHEVEDQKDNDLQSTANELQSKTSAATGVLSLPSSTETSPSKQGSRKQQNKAALGQQLLEAIGLQKINPKAPTISVHYVPSSSSSVSTSGPSTTKQSVQQIRSALKKSLKQAQEQQQLRNKDISSSVSTTVIQDADSTTKPVIKEIVIEHRSNKTTTSSSSHVDVEEEIDKITLMKSHNGPTTTVRTAKATLSAAETLSSAEKDELKKEQALKKKAAGRITERRRTLPSSVGRGRLSLNAKVEKPPLNIVEKEISEPKAEQEEKTKSEKDDTDILNISSSSITSTELSQVKEEIAVTPRRKGGRKRFTEAIDNTETASNSEKVKEKDKGTEKEKEKENEKDTKQTAEKSKTLDKIKEEQEETSSNSGRPTRQSKTLSKYYKGPEKAVTSRRSLPSRSTRNSMSPPPSNTVIGP